MEDHPDPLNPWYLSVGDKLLAYFLEKGKSAKFDEEVLSKCKSFYSNHSKSGKIKESLVYDILVIFLKKNAHKVGGNREILLEELEKWRQGLNAVLKYGSNLLAEPENTLFHRVKVSVFNISSD